MKAILVRQYGGPEAVQVETIADPVPEPGEVLVRVHAITVNRTRDLNVIRGEAGTQKHLPLTPGQDPAGEIVAVGPGVDTGRVGERVIVCSRIVCGECEACREGRGSECPSHSNIGIHRPGGYAELVSVPEATAFRIADQLSFAEAAVAMRHFPMAWHQLHTKAGVKPGEWVLVMGASGGLGSACVQVAKLAGARVIAGAGSAERVGVGLALGAEVGINYREEDLARRVREITDGKGANVICENISDPSTFPAAFDSLAMSGRLVTSGAHGGGTVPVDIKKLYQRRQRILGAAGYDPGDVSNAMEAAGRGTLKAVVDLELPLDRLVDAFEMIHTRKVAGKIVINPQLGS